MLACARIGAPHTVVFGGFSAESLSDRMNDMGCEVLITQDEAWRRGTTVPLKRTPTRRWTTSPAVQDVRRPAADRRRRPDAGGPRPLVARRSTTDDAATCPCEPMDAEDLLYLLYTSGHDRQAEGHRAHDRRLPRRRRDDAPLHLRHQARLACTGAPPTSAGSPGTATSSTGRSATATTGVMYEGTPDFPDKDRWWEIVERYRRRHPLHGADRDPLAHEVGAASTRQQHDLSSLRLLGSVGEPINPEAWVWYHEHIGGDRMPIVDTWWQTETGMILITPLPGRDDAEAGLGDEAVPGRRRGGLRRAGQRGRPGRRRLPRAPAAVAGDAARDLRRRRALSRDVLVEVPGHLLRRRRGADRRGRRLLAARPRRRRDERLGPPHLDDRGRERARRPPEGGRGGGVRPQRRARPARRSSPS